MRFHPVFENTFEGPDLAKPEAWQGVDVELA